MVEDGSLGRSCGASIVVHGDCVKQLSPHFRLECRSSPFDQPQPQVNVPEESALARGAEDWAASELESPAGVVQDGRSQEQVAAQARVQLRRLAAESGHADRVLEEAARVGVVTLGGGGEASELTSKVHVVHETCGSSTQSRVRDLTGQELEEAVELVSVSSQCGRERGGILAFGRLDRPYVELKLVAEEVDPAEDSHGVALREARIE